MLVVKSPLRLSFLGGGSDYFDFFSSEKGAVFGCTINLYVYVMALPLPPFAEEKIRFTYRKTESVSSISELQHPVIREILKRYDYKYPINIATMADVSGNSGLGSSSSFTVGSLLLFRHLLNLPSSPEALALEAIEIERNVLSEEGGFQDQYFAAYGGLRKFEFNHLGMSSTQNVQNVKFLKKIEENILLIPFGGERNSKIFAKKHITAIKETESRKRLLDLVHLTEDVVSKIDTHPEDTTTYENFIYAMKQSWDIKVKNSFDGDLKEADNFIQNAIQNGARAGKLCGAGSSGFILLFCPLELHNSLLSRIGAKNYCKPKIDLRGARFVEDELKGKVAVSETWDINRWTK